MTRSRSLRLLRSVWLGLLIWPYAVASGMPRPLLLASLPVFLAIAAGPGRLRYLLRWFLALLLGLLASLPTLMPGSLWHLLLSGGPHTVAVAVTSLLLWLTSLLGWQVFGEATARTRLTWLWLMGTLVLALNRRIWAIGADLPTLAYLSLGVVLLAIGGDDESVPWPAVPLAALPLVGLVLVVFWPQAPSPSIQPPGSVVRGLAGLRVAVSGASLPPQVNVNQPVSLSPAPLLIVRGAPHPAYWQEATFDTFNGVAWVEPPGPRIALGSHTLPSPLWSPQSQGLPQALWHVTVQEVLPGSIAPLVYTGTPVGLTAEAATTGGVFLPASHALLLPGTPTYTWQLMVPSQPASLLAKATFVPLAAAPKQDLAVPTVLRRELAPLAARLRRGGGGPWALAQRISQYLDLHEVYNPDFVPSRHRDPIGRFVLRSHEGYCDQFSTAFVMLARLDGLPARWVVGFAPGVWDPSAKTETLRAEDAHSWAQIDVAPYGWVQIDPTPGPAAVPAHPATRTPKPYAASVRGYSPSWPLAALLALIAVASTLRVVRLRRSPGWRLGRLERRLERMTRDRCQGRPTWREEVRSLPGQAQEAAWPALEVLEAAHYGKVPPDAEELRAAEQALGRAQRLLREKSG